MLKSNVSYFERKKNQVVVRHFLYVHRFVIIKKYVMIPINKIKHFAKQYRDS